MNHGQIEQLGAPERALRAAAHGVRRGLPRRLEPAPRRPSPAADAVQLDDGTDVSRAARPRSPGGRGAVQIGVRPEKISASAATSRDGNTLAGTVTETRVHRRLDAVHRRHAGRRRSPSTSRTTGRGRTAWRPATGSRSAGARSARSSSMPRRSRDVRASSHAVRTFSAAPPPAALMLAFPGSASPPAVAQRRWRRRPRRRPSPRHAARRRSSSRTGRSTST